VDIISHADSHLIAPVLLHLILQAPSHTTNPGRGKYRPFLFRLGFSGVFPSEYCLLPKNLLEIEAVGRISPQGSMMVSINGSPFEGEHEKIQVQQF
jgi:hypothetical protein